MPVGLNFSRRPFRDTRPITLTVAVSILLGVLLLTVNIRDFFDFRSRAAGTLSEIQRLNEKAGSSEAEAARQRSRIASSRLKELQVESGQLNAILRERNFSWIVLLSHLERVLPGDVFLTHLEPQVQGDGSAALTLSCVGKNGASIVRTLSALAKDPHFSDPLPLSESDPEKGSAEGFQFTIKVRYSPGELSS
jgi:hypothetical protein